MTSTKNGAGDRPVVGVFPGSFLAERPRLFSTLSSTEQVDFEGRSGGEHRGLQAAVVYEDATAAAELAAAGVPSLLFGAAPEPTSGGPELIDLADADHLDRRLRGRAILQEGGATLARLDTGGATVLASAAAGPVWLLRQDRGAPVHEVACAPAELGTPERLKDRLQSGRFIALLPLVHFLRDLLPPWEPPPLRASFVFDDANLHWRSYGYIRYRSLAEHAAAHGYHLGIAMIPLDGWFADRATAGCFAPGSPLALLVHGNNHTSHELGRTMADDEALTLAATAWQRVRAFEERSGVSVQRVMSPPHGAVSEPMLSALRRIGFDGTCYWGPTDEPPPALVGWQPADVHLGGGFPGVHRVPVDAPLDELLLRAYLGQPLLLSGHHIDLAAGLGVLVDAGERVGRLGNVEWTSVSETLARNVVVRHDGSLLRARPFAHRVRVRRPEGASSLVIDWVGPGAPSWTVSSGGAEVRAATAQEVPLPGAGPVEIRLDAVDAVDPRQIEAAPWRPWPVARRCLTEGRDRMQRMVRRASV